MAYTVTRYATVFGNKQVRMIKVTADAATQTVETGLRVVEHFSVGYGSMTTQGVKCYINSNASGVQSNGVLGMSGFASGDDFYVTVYGPT